MFKKTPRSTHTPKNHLSDVPEKKKADSLRQAILERNSAEEGLVEEEKERKLEEKRAARAAALQKKRQARKKAHRGTRHWYGVPVGLVVIIFAVIGVISSVKWVYTAAYNYLSDDSAERAYDTYLFPVVILDPQPFETIDGADNAMMLQAAIWKTMFDDLPTLAVESDELARILLPADLVEENAVELFGTQCILTPVDIPLQNEVGVPNEETGTESGETESDSEDNSESEDGEQENVSASLSTTIQYDAEKDVYHVPTLSINSYHPYVKKIVKTAGGDKILTVGYYSMAGTNEYSPSAGEINEETFVKDMEYKISYDSDTQQEYISAIRVVKE